MKKLICVLLLVCMMPVFAAAEFSDLSFDELLELRTELEAEIISRPEWKEVTVPSGTWIVGEDIPVGSYSIHPTSKGAYFRLKRNGWTEISQGIRKENAAFGKIILQKNDVVEIEDGSLIFAPPEGLGF